MTRPPEGHLVGFNCLDSWGDDENLSDMYAVWNGFHIITPERPTRYAEKRSRRYYGKDHW